MPLRLKNVGATYQRLDNRMVSRQIRRKMEVYVDDTLIKSREENTHRDGLKKTLHPLGNTK